jgi:7-keto-8-aminopelargonate synthetase-like enzyme
MDGGMDEMSARRSANVFVPICLLAVAMVVWSGFQASQLYQERSNLATLRSNQETTFRNAEKMRAQLEALASGTQKLATAGNRNAQAVVGALQQRGITINPEAKKPQ